jgi:hypothetical protein
MTENTKFYLGLDVSEPYFDVSMLMVVSHQKQPMHTERFDNTAAGLKAFHKWLVLMSTPCWSLRIPECITA